MQNSKAPTQPNPALKEVPSLLETELYILILKKNATGPDALPPELYQVAPATAARIVHPLIVKVASKLQAAGPLQGGLYRSLFKGKGGSTHDADSTRAIQLADALAKIVRKPFRSRIGETAEQWLWPLQLGGRKGMSCDMATHANRALQEVARHLNLSLAILFADLKDAFYSAICTIIFMSVATTDDSQITDIASSLGLAPPAFQELIENLSQACIWKKFLTSDP